MTDWGSLLDKAEAEPLLFEGVNTQVFKVNWKVWEFQGKPEIRFAANVSIDRDEQTRHLIDGRESAAFDMDEDAQQACVMLLGSFDSVFSNACRVDAAQAMGRMQDFGLLEVTGAEHADTILQGLEARAKTYFARSGVDVNVVTKTSMAGMEYRYASGATTLTMITSGDIAAIVPRTVAGLREGWDAWLGSTSDSSAKKWHTDPRRPGRTNLTFVSGSWAP